MNNRLSFIVGIIWVTCISAAPAAAQSCVFGEPATPSCTSPRVIDGSFGQHVVLMDVGTATGQATQCGALVGNRVWFEVTPVVTGTLIISTCHPNTQYDTVLEVFSGGDSNCDFMAQVGCNDDSLEPECASSCSARASRVALSATAGTKYRFVVGSFNNNSAGCPTCLGVIVTIDGTCGDPPRNFICEAAKELPGTAGKHRDVIDLNDMPSFPEASWPPECSNAIEIGHNVWYKFTADVDGLARFSTCNPSTTYDTVVRRIAGPCNAQFQATLDCNDDTSNPACQVACSATPRASEIQFPVSRGSEHWIEVGAYNDNLTGCPLCLESTLEVFDCAGSDPPIVGLSAPTDFGCVCNGETIVGSAYHLGVLFKGFRLEYRAVQDVLWTEIVSGNQQVVNGVLANWDTTGLTDGWYFLRLTGETVCGQDSADTKIVRVGSAVDTARLDAPANGGIYGGNVCFDGTAWDQSCFDHYEVGYRPSGSTGTFSPVDPVQPTYTTTKINQGLAVWDTIASAVPDGNYEVSLHVADRCQNAADVTRTVFVDNTPPVAVIRIPTPCEYVDGMVDILGTALDANIESWVLQYTGDGLSVWSTIATGTTNVDGLLAQWDTSTLPSCPYTLRLVVTDKARLNCNGAIPHRSEYTRSIYVGLEHDADSDRDVDLNDFADFQGDFTGPR